MKDTGIMRRLDKLGRVVLPIELRNTLNITVGDPIEIYTEGNTIMLKKHEPWCIFCGEVKNLLEHKNKRICRACLSKLK